MRTRLELAFFATTTVGELNALLTRLDARISSMLPGLGEIADDVCLVRSMHTEAVNHAPGVTFFLTGAQDHDAAIGAGLRAGQTAHMGPGGADPARARHFDAARGQGHGAAQLLELNH